MNLRDLHYVVAVADLRNFSQAAEQCNVSQPTLSGQIKKLEEQLGVALFERTNKRVMPTQAGEAIILSARRILREAHSIEEIAANAHDPLAGTFRLGAFPTLASYIFPDLVPAIKQALPKLRLILVEDKTAVLLEKLHSGALDAALLALPVYDDYLVSQALFDDEFLLAVPPQHPLAKEKSVKQSALAKHKLLLLEEGHCLRDQALDVCQLHNIPQEEDFRATGLETLREMVKAGTGITLMPRLATRKDEHNICYVPLSNPTPSRTIGLVWRKTTTRQEALEKIAAVAEAL